MILYIIVIVVLVLSALIGSLVFAVIRYLRYVQPTEREIKDDLSILRTMIEPWKGSYVPIDQQMIGLLSQKPTEKVHEVKKKAGLTVKGIFENALQEPFMGYAYRKYIAPGVNGIMYAETAHHEYVFRFTNKGTEVFIDGHKVGKFNRKNVDYFDNDGRLLAQIGKNIGGVTVNISGKDAVVLPISSSKLLEDNRAQAVELETPAEIEIREAILVFYYGLEALKK